MTQDDVSRVLKRWVAPIFSSECARIGVLTSNPSKVEENSLGMEKLGIKMETIQGLDGFFPWKFLFLFIFFSLFFVFQKKINDDLKINYFIFFILLCNKKLLKRKNLTAFPCCVQKFVLCTIWFPKWEGKKMSNTEHSNQSIR